jgi:hypothetical protein
MSENVCEEAALFADQLQQCGVKFFVCHAVCLAWVFSLRFSARGLIIEDVCERPREAGFACARML